jgi:hypothetical protein
LESILVDLFWLNTFPGTSAATPAVAFLFLMKPEQFAAGFCIFARGD